MQTFADQQILMYEWIMNGKDQQSLKCTTLQDKNVGNNGKIDNNTNVDKAASNMIMYPMAI